MAQNFSKYVSDPKVQVISAATAAIIAWYIKNGLAKKRPLPRRPKPPQMKPEDQIQYMIVEKNTKKPKPQVNAKFFSELRMLLRIMIPGLWSKECGYLALVAGALVMRTFCDLWMIQNATLIESSIINMNRQLFVKRLLKFFMAMPVISTVNNIMKYSIGELKLCLRTNMTYNLYNDYLKGYTYYKMSNLDNRISNADQLLTNDVDKFCETITDLYSNVSKPILDIGIYVYRLTTTLGGQTPALMLSYLLFSGFFLTYLRKPTARMTVTEQKLEGEFRYINSRLITNSEEVAFYNGNNREKLTLLASFNKLTNHLRKFLEFRVMMGVVDNVVAKYFASCVGFYSVSIPFFVKDHPLLDGNHGSRFRLYYTYGRMLVKLAEAIGRLVLSGRELTKLAGLTSRVTELKTVLNDLNNGHYQRTMVDGTENRNENSNDTAEAIMPLIPNSGTIIFKDHIIKFDKVPLVTPNGDLLVKELNFEVRSGMNVLVCGPNGCGKSSLFRILGELWPMFGGTLTKPPRGRLFYIPQRPYMTLGTLRDQVIYPHTHQEMLRRGKTDEDLNEYLDIVQLSYLHSREGGWNAIADWIDVLSGGEKQRIAMARLFYHAPQFAILDECTSAVSVDVEGSMYQYCKKVGISLFTVSHRKSLWTHHDYYLKMDGRGDFKFGLISEDTQEFGS